MFSGHRRRLRRIERRRRTPPEPPPTPESFGAALDDLAAALDGIDERGLLLRLQQARAKMGDAGRWTTGTLREVRELCDDFLDDTDDDT